MHLHICLVILYLLNRGSYIMCLYVLSFVLRLQFPHKKRCSIRLYLQLFVGGLMSYLRYLWLFTYIGFQHLLRCVFVLFYFVLCTLLSICDCPSVFSNAYWTNIEQHYAHVFTTSHWQKYCIAYYYNAYYTEQQPTAKTKCIFDFKLN
jgi:hypothetical protein